MRAGYWFGLLLLLLAGIPQGAFTLPMKFVRRWKWEHLWLVYSLLSFFVLPLLIAVWTVPALARVYQECIGQVLWLTALFGAGWGVGSVFFGLGVDALGMALGFSLMTGIYTAIGALVPLIILTPGLLWTQKGAYIIAGNLVMIVGVAMCAVAGELRDKQSPASGPPTLNPRVSFRLGLVICIAGGVFSAMFNFCYAFGKQIVDVAQRFGATQDGGVNAMWLVALPSGGILNVAYCLYLMHRQKSWSLLWRRTAPSDWVQASLMAVMWTGSVVVYGWGANQLGSLGPSLGWSFFNVILTITTVACGLLTHEWDGVKGRPLWALFLGITVLILSTVLLGLGGAGG